MPRLNEQMMNEGPKNGQHTVLTCWTWLGERSTPLRLYAAPAGHLSCPPMAGIASPPGTSAENQRVVMCTARVDDRQGLPLRVFAECADTSEVLPPALVNVHVDLL